MRISSRFSTPRQIPLPSLSSDFSESARIPLDSGLFYSVLFLYNKGMFNLSVGKRIIAALAVLAALGYVAVTHAIAADIYAKDTKEKKETKD